MANNGVEPDGLGPLIGAVRAEFVRALERELAREGVPLRFSQFRVVKLLALQGAMMTTELARAVDHDAGAMTRLLDQLVARGYLRRVPRPEDRRAVLVELTEAGRLVWAAIDRVSSGVGDAALQNLSPTEREQLLDLLRRIRRSLQERNNLPEQ